jgi:ribonuclease P protein component
VTSTLHGGRSAPARPRLWRVTERAAFQALRREGRRGRHGSVSVTWLPDAGLAPGAPPRVACAVGKATGGAVVRNRIRRRLRSGALELRRADRLPDGTYLLAGSSAVADLAFDDLVRDLDAAVAAALGARR